MAEQITAAAIISFSERLQDASERFYRGLAEAYPEHRRVFEGYAGRCARDKVHLVRTYQETVTDALETNYSFEGLVLPRDLLDASLPPGAGEDEALETAIRFEEGVQAFYEEVAATSEALLATIPRAYRRIATRRGQQAAELRALRGG